MSSSSESILQVESSLPMRLGDVQSSKQPLIMIVDDEPLNIEVLQSLLESSGYTRFASVTDPQLALDAIETQCPDVVLLDLVMPGKTGFEILAELREREAVTYTPVIVLTASVDSQNKTRALECGATDFLSKPVDASELTLRLRNTLAAKRFQDRLAFFDSLTGLPNRRLFLERLGWALTLSKRDSTIGAVMQINIDRFRQINDAVGLGLGDVLLTQVAARLESCIRASDALGLKGNELSEFLLARPGGDEFNLLLSNLARPNDAATVCQRLITVLTEPFIVNDQSIFLSASIGVAVFPSDGIDADTLLKHASQAVGEAKKKGGKAFRFFAADLNEHSRNRLSIESQLRIAMEQRQLQLHLQPKIEVKGRKLCGAEALLRWTHPERGPIPPSVFIPVAEESGLIGQLGLWVIDEACRLISGWKDQGFPVPRIALNVSAKQFLSNDFELDLIKTLARYRLSPKYLTLELTESVLMNNPKECIELMQRLQAGGFKLSIDDFGTGYSSLSYLKRLPLDELKIDRSFVNEVHTDSDSAAIATAIISMAHALGLKVVAEGVENEAQLDVLASKNCDQCQGYFFSKPMPAEDFGKILQRAAIKLATKVDDHAAVPS